MKIERVVRGEGKSMRRKLDLGYLNDVLVKHYKSKADMAKQLGITRSHVQEVFKNVGVGDKVLNGLQKEATEKGFDYGLCLHPEPMIINGNEVQSVEVTDNQGGVIASISSREIITDSSTTVIVVPEPN